MNVLFWRNFTSSKFPPKKGTISNTIGDIRLPHTFLLNECFMVPSGGNMLLLHLECYFKSPPPNKKSRWLIDHPNLGGKLFFLNKLIIYYDKMMEGKDKTLYP